MLKIQGYYKLCNKSLPNQYWNVAYMAERDEEYEIALDNTMDGKRRYLILNRNPEFSSVGRVAYFFKENNIKLNACMTPDYMGDMNNFLIGIQQLVKFG